MKSLSKNKKSKKESVPVQESSPSDNSSYESSDGSEDQVMGGASNLREADQRNLLNYQTDSDEDDVDSSEDDLGTNLEKQKREIADNDAVWGKSKGGYYKADSDSDEGSENEEDLAKEALRLQKIRQ